MPYISTIDDKSYRIDAGEHTAQREVTLEDQSYTIDWRRISALAADGKISGNVGGRYTLLINNRSYEVFARPLDQDPGTSGQTYEIQFGGRSFEVYVEDERDRTLSASVRGSQNRADAQLRAPMPGLVLDLPFETGSSVSRGQTVAVLEAMKMENDLGSPINGTIKEIKVQKGQTVNQGQILLIVTGE